MALRVAVAVGHAPGFGGTPSRGQRSTAVANASVSLVAVLSCCTSGERLVGGR
jgi:hypothetical protein